MEYNTRKTNRLRVDKMNYDTIRDINSQISTVKVLTNDNIKDMSSDDAAVIYTELIKVSNILLDKLITYQNKRENNNC